MPSSGQGGAGGQDDSFCIGNRILCLPGHGKSRSDNPGTEDVVLLQRNPSSAGQSAEVQHRTGVRYGSGLCTAM